MTPQPNSNNPPGGDLSPEGLDAVAFLKTKRRGDSTVGVAMRGFGKAGNFTLFLPPAKTERTMTFRNGKPASVLAQSSLDDARLLELVEIIVKSSVNGARGVLIVDQCFYEYAAALISRNYEVTDEDLTFLLGGTGWHDPMYRHLLGMLAGNENVKKLAELTPVERRAAPIHPAHVVPDLPAQPFAPRSAVQKRRRWWHRFTR